MIEDKFFENVAGLIVVVEFVVVSVLLKMVDWSFEK